MMSTIFDWLQLGLGVFGLIFLILITFLLIVMITIPLSLQIKKHALKESKIKVKKLNEVYQKQSDVILEAMLSPKEYKKHLKAQKDFQKKSKEETDHKKNVFVLDFKGDLSASQVTFLREHVSALLKIAKQTDEIVVCLESPGGLVQSYGLAASQLARIRQAGIPLTVCVDKVAASGGYMMACLANKIIAAPFAILGSIGVLASIPNLHKLLKKHDVDYYEITAGKYKRTLTTLGESTAEKIEKSKEKVQEIHKLFKDHILKYRSQVEIDNIANGDYWFGHQAIDLKLIDEIKTSDDYLLSLSLNTNIFLVFTPQMQSLRNKIFSGFSNIWYTIFGH